LRQPWSAIGPRSHTATALGRNRLLFPCRKYRQRVRGLIPFVL